MVTEEHSPCEYCDGNIRGYGIIYTCDNCPVITVPAKVSVVREKEATK
jgi:hypothetical protein